MWGFRVGGKGTLTKKNKIRSCWSISREFRRFEIRTCVHHLFCYHWFLRNSLFSVQLFLSVLYAFKLFIHSDCAYLPSCIILLSHFSSLFSLVASYIYTTTPTSLWPSLLFMFSSCRPRVMCNSCIVLWLPPTYSERVRYTCIFLSRVPLRLH